MYNEYNGLDTPPIIKATINNHIKLSNRLAPKLKIVPIVQTINIKTRRSILSDIQPIGYCKIMPPKYIEATNNDISFTDKPLSVPSTEAIPNKAAKISPKKNYTTKLYRDLILQTKKGHS